MISPSDLFYISYREAVYIGLDRYFTGEPCSKGHICEKYVGNRVCIICLKEDYKKYPSKMHNSKSRKKYYGEIPTKEKEIS